MMSLQQAYLNVASTQPTSEDVKRRLDRAYDIVRTQGGYEITKHESSRGICTVCSSEVLGYVCNIHGDDYLSRQCYIVYKVHKASTSLLDDNSIVYTVDSTSCTCPDFMSARGGMCKHRLAVAMTIEMEK